MKELESLIDPLHIEDLRNEMHPSFFDENEGYSMLISRLPVIDEGGLDVKSIGFILTPYSSYLYDKSKKSFEDLGNKFEDVHKIIDDVLDQLIKSFASYQDAIADMEERLYADKTTDSFMKNWLELKRDIVRIERVLLRSSTSMNEMIRAYNEDGTFPINHYIDLHEHMERTMRSAGLQLSKLDYIYSFYTVRTNEKMNKMIYVLTFISAVFLPLNLVVGFFGMNTSGLPFATGDFGTLNAVTLMGSLLILTLGGMYLWNKKHEKE